jgi:transcriptional regulator with XRE-family HTH domain
MSTDRSRKHHHPRTASFYLTFANTVRNKRVSHGWTQEKLAAHLDMRRVSIANIERNHTWPDLVTVARLCEALHINRLEF